MPLFWSRWVLYPPLLYFKWVKKLQWVSHILCIRPTSALLLSRLRPSPTTKLYVSNLQELWVVKSTPWDAIIQSNGCHTLTTTGVNAFRRFIGYGRLVHHAGHRNCTPPHNSCQMTIGLGQKGAYIVVCDEQCWIWYHNLPCPPRLTMSLHWWRLHPLTARITLRPVSPSSAQSRRSDDLLSLDLVASAVFLLYDTLLCFDQEVCYMWR
jgi:hypothetical protein